MTKLKEIEEIFQQKGLRIKAAKADEETDDYIFAVEDNEGNVHVFHFYLTWLSSIPMVEVYLFSSFKRRERNKLLKRPQEFLEKFNHYMMLNLADFVMDENVWLDQ
mgnify:CR=1 FL=1